MPPRVISENRLLFLIAAVQFVNILDFMMVMPLGPDLAQALGIRTSDLGIVGGSYTAAAAVSGILSSLFLDRFDRRVALAVALFGLVIGTAAGGLATGLSSLLASRVMAGTFGGPATSLALSIVADVVPPERRGRAMGIVMGAFSVASVLGVPAGLELARLGGVRAPFFAVAILGAVIATLSIFMMPSFTSHISGARGAQGTSPSLLRRPVVLLSLAAMACTMMGNFAIIPNLATFWQFNRAYPREQLGLLYLIGGTVSFGTVRLSGWLIDRVGPARVSVLGTAFYVATLVVGFIAPADLAPVMLVFVAFMVTGSFRMVPMQSLSSRVPAPEERARFMSIQSCVQHMAAAAGATLGSRMLVELPDRSLGGMEQLVWFSITLALFLPVLLWTVERRVKQAASVPLSRH